jgi:putative aminopeptidase FrvX
MYRNYKNTLPGKIELNENHTIVPDLEMLKTFLRYRSHSRSQTQIEFRDYLIDYFDGLNQNLLTEIDQYGNLYVTKGKSDLYPCMVAHLDINQDKVNNFEIVTVGDWMFGFNTDEAVQCGLGFDDKAGVAAAIEVFNRVDVIKLFFPLDEECGF